VVLVVVEILLHWLTLVDLVVEDHQARMVLQVIHLRLIPLKVKMVEMVQVQVDMLVAVEVEQLVVEVIQGQTIMVLMEEMEVLEHLIQF
tara:strand:+ start:41 stop:307 length:267 start_codon:yes stop_codon:yes gene_type:complete